MQYTNKYNIPKEIVELLIRDRHPPQKDRIGVVSLVSPYLMRELERRYWDQLIIDVSELVFMLQGRAFHLLMEQASNANALKEQKLEMQSNTGVTLVGKPDRWESGVLTDYKTTSVWAAIRGTPPEWTAQVNVYAYLLKECLNVHTSSCMAVAYFRDWSINKAKQGGNFPQCAIKSFDLELWNPSVTRSYIQERIQGHQGAQNLSLDKLPPCSSLEMWEQPIRYAVKKKGVKSARRVLDSREAAQEWITANSKENESPDTYSIEERPGERPRCEDFCLVRHVCPVRNQHKAASTLRAERGDYATNERERRRASIGKD